MGFWWKESRPGTKETIRIRSIEYITIPGSYPHVFCTGYGLSITDTVKLCLFLKVYPSQVCFGYILDAHLSTAWIEIKTILNSQFSRYSGSGSEVNSSYITSERTSSSVGASTTATTIYDSEV